jgi:hypothetical protein
MYIKNKFILNNGEKIEIITRTDEPYQVHTDKMANLIFKPDLGGIAKVDAITLTSASEDHSVAIRTSEICAYEASIEVLK